MVEKKLDRWEDMVEKKIIRWEDMVEKKKNAIFKNEKIFFFLKKFNEKKIKIFSKKNKKNINKIFIF